MRARKPGLEREMYDKDTLFGGFDYGRHCCRDSGLTKGCRVRDAE